MFKIIIFLLILSITPVFAEWYCAPNANVNTYVQITDNNSWGGMEGYYTNGKAKSALMYVEFKCDSVYDTTSTSPCFLFKSYQYQFYSYISLGVSNGGGTYGETGHICFQYDDEGMSYILKESASKITLGDGVWHDMALYVRLDDPNNLVYYKLYLDGELIEDFSRSSTTTYITRNNYVNSYTFLNGSSGSNMNYGIRNASMIYSSNSTISCAENIYTTIRASSGGSMLQHTWNNPVDYTPNFNQSNGYGVLFNNCCGDISGLNATKSEMPFNNFDALGNRKLTHQPARGVAENATFTTTPHGMYYTNTQKRRR